VGAFVEAGDSGVELVEAVLEIGALAIEHGEHGEDDGVMD
jgi:hypothetical protein